MAIKVITDFAPFVIASTGDTYVIGDGSQAFAATWVLDIRNSSGTVFDGTATVVARSREIGSRASTPTFHPIPYLPLSLAGTAAASYPTYSDADITGTALIYVPATGLTIGLEIDSWTEGSLTVYATPLVGAAC